MHWGRLAWVVAVVLLAAPVTAADECTDAVPCRLDAVVTQDAFRAPTQASSLGPFVLAVANQANRTTDVSIEGLTTVTVPANGTAESTVFRFPSEATYVVQESAGGRMVHIEVSGPGASPPASTGPSANEILAVALPLLVGLALLALATLVLRKGGNHLHARLFGVLFLLSGIKSFGDGLTAPFQRADGSIGFVANELHASSPLFPDALTWLRITIVCALAMLPVLFLFSATFPHAQPWMLKHRWRSLLAFLPSVVVGWVVFVSPESPWFNDIVLGFNVVATAMTATALALIIRTHRRSPDHIERKQALYVALGFLPSFVATWVITFYIFGAEGGWIPLAEAHAHTGFVLRFMSPVFEMVAAGLVGFAILKYNILGVDPKFRVGVKSAVVGFVFVLVFLLTQAIENIVLQGQLFAFAGEYGSFLLSGTTSIVLFKPIEKLSSKVSDRLLPRPASGDAALSRAAEVYHAQCSYVLRDAQVSDREMAFLKNLRTQLGLSDAQARAIEEEVERLLKVDAPQTGATAGTAVHHVATAHDEVAGSTPEVHRASPLPSEQPPAAPDPGPAAQPTDQPPT